METRNVPWKAEWKAAGLDPGPLTPEEEALVPELERENREFLAKHPRKARPAAAPRKVLPWSAWGLPLAAAAALLVVFTVPVAGPLTGEAGLERVKGAGDPGLVVYREGKAGPEKLAPRASVRAGDILQAAYQVSKPTRGALLSLDGSGNVTVHLAKEGRSVALVPGAERRLDFSYELDRAPRFEVFFLFTSDRDFDLEPLRQILKQTPWESLSPGAFGPDLRFAVLPLAKEATR